MLNKCYNYIINGEKLANEILSILNFQKDKLKQKYCKFTINKISKGLKLRMPKKDTIEHDIIEMHLPTDEIKKVAKGKK